MIQKCLLTLCILVCVKFNAQNVYKLGIVVGISDWLRKDDPTNYFNYTQKEIRLYTGKDFAWKNNMSSIWNKYWVTQLTVGQSEYNWTLGNKDETTYHSHFTTGIRFEKNIANKINFESSILLSSGYHSGLTERMTGGIYFREGIEAGIHYNWSSGFSNQFNLGFQHASNANIYDINRGFEVLYFKLGVLWIQKK